MFSLLELALNNDYIYIGIIGVLIVIIILTILSIKKDRDKAIKSRSYVKPVITEEEREQAKLELEKVVDEMQKKLDNEKVPANDITTYEEEQESKAIISYQELVAAVRNNNEAKVHNEVGMEVADANSIEPANEEITLEDVIESVKKAPVTDTLEEVKPVEEKTEYIPVEDKIVKPYSEENFQNSEVISPIFGSATTKEDEVVYNELDSDMEEVDEFLDSLKDFRKKL